MASASDSVEVPVFINTSLQTHIVIYISPDLTAAEFNKNKREEKEKKIIKTNPCLAFVHSMASVSTAIEVPVFVDTSLQTHIVFSVSPDLTAAEFNRKFEMMHLNCFPGIGNIKVDGLMVKKKSHLYHLPASMPIKHVFQDSKKTWLLYTQISSKPDSDISPRGLSENICKKPAKKMEPTSERISETVSVSGIIKKYFSLFDDEVTSSGSKPRVPNYAPKTPPTMTKVGGSRDTKRIGKRLIVAANNLGISSDQKPVVSLCKQKCDKFKVPKSSSTIRHPVFEIGDE